jgi:outer membrane biosynthesis protein TonB
MESVSLENLVQTIGSIPVFANIAKKTGMKEFSEMKFEETCPATLLEVNTVEEMLGNEAHKFGDLFGLKNDELPGSTEEAVNEDEEFSKDIPEEPAAEEPQAEETPAEGGKEETAPNLEEEKKLPPLGVNAEEEPASQEEKKKEEAAPNSEEKKEEAPAASADEEEDDDDFSFNGMKQYESKE